MLGFILGATAIWAGQQLPPEIDLPKAEPAPQASLRALSLSPLFPASVRHWTADIDRWAEEFDLPADLVAVVMTLESCGNPTVRSAAGAQGLFQVMPFHFASGEDPYDPEVNAQRGLAYLKGGLALASGDTGLAMAGYNGGHSLIGRDPSSWPAETVRYVRWGQGILADLTAGLPASPTLEAWRDAGGEQLCRRAGTPG
jgi:soluble lytic murein transglycosylase-like protein